jgi:hypothetical protein
MLQMYRDALCMYLLFVESALVPRQVLRMKTYRDRSRDRMILEREFGSLGVLGVLGGGSAANTRHHASRTRMHVLCEPRPSART